MKETLKKSFEVLLKNGEYAEAEKLLVPYMKDNPDDWDAKLLYGTCRMMQGDAETAKLVNQQAQGHFESGRDIPEEQKYFWDKYKKFIEKTYKETPKQTKSASGIWAWIFCLLFASAVIVVVIGAFGNSIWYALTGKEHRPEDTWVGLVMAPSPDDRVHLDDGIMDNSKMTDNSKSSWK